MKGRIIMAMRFVCVLICCAAIFYGCQTSQQTPPDPDVVAVTPPPPPPPPPKPESKPLVKPPAKPVVIDGGNYWAWYATNRQPVDPRDEKKGFTNKHDTKVHYGKVLVSIPEDYLRQTRKPWWQTLFSHTAEENIKLLGIDPLLPSGFIEEIKQQLAQRDPNERSTLIYVHGFNTSFEDAARRAAAIGFAVHVPVTTFFSWPSTPVKVPVPAAYKADLAEINNSTDELAKFLVKVAKESGARQLHLVAHSMGNHGLLRAMYQPIAQAAIKSGIRFENIILAAPDVSRDEFLKQASVFGKVARRTTLYVSSGDLALEASQVVNKNGVRVGYGPPVMIVPGIDSISAGGVDLSLLGHAYLSGSIDVLKDMNVLIWDNAAPGSVRRSGLLRQEDRERNVYWVIQ